MDSVPYSYQSVNLTEVDILSFPHSKKQTAGEIYSSSCPFCQEGADRFTFWLEDGNYYCRRCDTKGHLKSIPFVTPEIKRKWEANRQEVRRTQREKNLSAIEKLQKRRPDLIYHQNLNGKSTEIKKYWGIDNDHIDLFKLGYCSCCPTSPKSESITIPYYWQNKIISLRHRLLSTQDTQGKYRPEVAGLPAAIFNADMLRDNSENIIILVEGEFKAIVLLQFGFPAVAIPGANVFKPHWANLFKGKKRVYIALDPNTKSQAQKIGELLSPVTHCRVASLPFKPDDMLIKYDYGLNTFTKILEMGRPI